MKKLIPINLDNEIISLHPLRQIDMARMANIEDDIFEILNNNKNTEFIQEKRLKRKEDAKERIYGFILGYQTGLSYAHFITEKRTNKVIGFINIISPERAKQIYKLENYHYIIEYVLHRNYWGKGLMTSLIGAVCKRMNNQEIKTISAVCDISNLGSIKILERNGFKRKSNFDIKSNYYELQIL